MTIDGKAIAEEIYARLQTDGIVRGARLGVVVCEPNAVIESFVRIKARAAERLGVTLVREDLPAYEGTAGLIAALQRMVSVTDALIVQLPLPKEIDTDAVLTSIPATHDVDGIGKEPIVMPPVARAVKDILKRHDVRIPGTRVVVVGAGKLVGAPAARMLQAGGAHVEVITKGDSLSPLHDADIVVSGAGEPGLITPDLIREGVVFIDAGTSEQGGRVRGDADPACAPKCSVFTPVPGGVGPVAVAEIFENLAFLIRQR